MRPLQLPGCSNSSSAVRHAHRHTWLHGAPPRSASAAHYADSARQGHLAHPVLTAEQPKQQHEHSDAKSQPSRSGFGAPTANLAVPGLHPAAAEDASALLRSPIAMLQAYAECSSQAPSTPAARMAGLTVREVVAEAINSKAPNLRSLQMLVGSSKGVVDALVHLARQGHMLGYEVLQLLCYRNTVACQQLLERGVVETIAEDLPEASTSMQCVMCALLTTLAAFNPASHTHIHGSGLIPTLVMLCGQFVHVEQSPEDSPQAQRQLENQSAAVLRNLSHNPAMHPVLIQAGAVEALAKVMRGRKWRPAQEQEGLLQDPQVALSDSSSDNGNSSRSSNDGDSSGSNNGGDHGSGGAGVSGNDVQHHSSSNSRPKGRANGHTVAGAHPIPGPLIVGVVGSRPWVDDGVQDAGGGADGAVVDRGGTGGDVVVRQSSFLPAAVTTATLGDDADGTEWEEARSRINAALAVAILIGHEEGAVHGLELDEELVGQLMEALQAAVQGVLYLGVFWTAWKLCQGLANLTVNEKNRERFAAQRGVQLMAEVLLGRHDNEDVAHRYALSTLWNLAFEERCRVQVRSTPGLVDAIRTILATTEATATREAAKGALWTLGLGSELRAESGMASAAAAATAESGVNAEASEGSFSLATTREEVGVEGAGVGAANHPVASASCGHVMLSYEWGQQPSVLLIKSELQRAGYRTWMDVDLMSGSTLEAMAEAVEGSAVVLVCLSKKYKESQACRTEAEYAFQQRKKIVPIIMEDGYQPTGWLGALIGARQKVDMSNPKAVVDRMPSLLEELGDQGKLPPSATVPGSVVKGTVLAAEQQGASVALPAGLEAMAGAGTRASEQETARASGPAGLSGETGADHSSASKRVRADQWSCDDVAAWLDRQKCGQYAEGFRQQCMDGRALCGLFRLSSSDTRLADEMLEGALGVSNVGHRLRLMEAMQRLFVRGGGHAISVR